MENMLDYYYKNPDYLINYSHTVSHEAQSFDFHLHNRYKIYFFISGNVDYFIERKMYRLKYGDMLIFNNQEIHKPSLLPGSPYERIIIHFDPSIPFMFGLHGRNLLDCFQNRPCGEGNKTGLNEFQIREVLSRLSSIETLDPDDESSKLLKLVRFIDILHFINQLFSDAKYMDDHQAIPEKLVPVFNCIEENLEKELSLATLEHKFYINRYHLCRLFKKSAGRSLHEYIIYKRISRSKKLLSEGKSVTEAGILSGFSDYSNFLRIFKRTVGLTPGQYRKMYRISPF